MDVSTHTSSRGKLDNFRRLGNQADRSEAMELDWYSNRLSANAVLTPTSSLRWMSSFGDSDRQSSPRWLSFRNMMPDRKTMRSYYSGDEYSPPGSNVSSPKKPEVVQCHRSLSGGDDRCPIDSPRSPSSSKSHVCFGCVLHSHE